MLSIVNKTYVVRLNFVFGSDFASGELSLGGFVAFHFVSYLMEMQPMAFPLVGTCLGFGRRCYV